MKTTPPTSKEKLPSEELIRRRAYELYEQRGRPGGHELDDWLEGEREVLEDDVREKAAA